MSPTSEPALSWRELNRAWWDERVPIHLASGFYDVAGYRAGRDRMRGFEVEELGDVAGKRLVHLQCHFGQDTLSWAMRGAHVSGVDFSAPAIEAARRLAGEMGVADARFVVADVYDAPAALGVGGSDGAAGRYDVVYTGCGALVWLPDLGRWARAVADLLVPGGTFYLSEFHPIIRVIDEETGVTVVGDYFAPDPEDCVGDGSYADPDVSTVSNRSVQWQHGIGEVVSSLAEAGLRIEFLHEHDMIEPPLLHSLVMGDDGLHRFPPGSPRVPLMYSIRARKV